LQSGKGIVGIEADASPIQRNLGIGCDVGGISCQVNISGVYSVRARFGWVFDNVMVYGSGGVASLVGITVGVISGLSKPSQNRWLEPPWRLRHAEG
jgi:hypothetical protein